MSNTRYVQLFSRLVPKNQIFSLLFFVSMYQLKKIIWIPSRNSHEIFFKIRNSDV